MQRLLLFVVFVVVHLLSLFMQHALRRLIVARRDFRPGRQTEVQRFVDQFMFFLAWRLEKVVDDFVAVTRMSGLVPSAPVDHEVAVHETVPSQATEAAISE